MLVKTTRDIAALVRDRRTQLGWSQGDLAGRVGVSRRWILELESGKSTTHLALVLRTVKELGLVLDASLPSEPQTPKKAKVADVNLDELIERSLSREK